MCGELFRACSGSASSVTDTSPVGSAADAACAPAEPGRVVAGPSRSRPPARHCSRRGMAGRPSPDLAAASTAGAIARDIAFEQPVVVRATSDERIATAQRRPTHEQILIPLSVHVEIIGAPRRRVRRRQRPSPGSRETPSMPPREGAPTPQSLLARRERSSADRITMSPADAKPAANTL
jgi:hypothetical protein